MRGSTSIFAGMSAFANYFASTQASPIEKNAAGNLAARTMPASPTPTITSTSFELPYPYYYPAVTLTANSAGETVAVFAAMTQYPCGGKRTAWLGETTTTLQVPCLGATQLSTSLRFGKCPLGEGPGPPQAPTVLATQTRFEFACSPTPDPHPTPRPTDFTTNLPAPTLPPGFAPSYTPVGVEAASFVEGWCYARVNVQTTDSNVVSSQCQECPTCASPTKYTSTVTTTVGVDCKPFAGKCAYETMTHLGDWIKPAWCSSYAESRRAPTVTAKVARTTWEYSCLPTQTS